LKKGFRVVAIEANPDLCARAGERLKEWIDAGRLTILNVGVGVEPGVMDFYRNLDKDDWSSFDKSWGTKEGTRAEIIKVRCVDFADILREHGMPYYLKIDVEGCDIAVVRTLHRFAHRPRYLSMEEHESHYFAELYSVGGRAFKVINQAQHWQHALPNPAREGKYVEQSFELGATGPFGEETLGDWLTFGESLDWYFKHVRNEREQLFATDGWYDIHIRIDR
jgi:FkbM family methyltransferase